MILNIIKELQESFSINENITPEKLGFEFIDGKYEKSIGFTTINLQKKNDGYAIGIYWGNSPLVVTTIKDLNDYKRFEEFVDGINTLRQNKIERN